MDELVEMISDTEAEPVICPDCQNKMERQIPNPNFQFANGFFGGMGAPRRVEITYNMKDGTKIPFKPKNIPTDC
jgi:hypothetical protein